MRSNCRSAASSETECGVLLGIGAPPVQKSAGTVRHSGVGVKAPTSLATLTCDICSVTVTSYEGRDEQRECDRTRVPAGARVWVARRAETQANPRRLFPGRSAPQRSPDQVGDRPAAESDTQPRSAQALLKA